jgi:cytochrome c biogenesis protein CcmG, thiol:disulfide interchange protein DsbE
MMTKLRCLLLGLFLLIDGLAMAQQVGDKATSFSLVDDSGELISLETFLGKPLILNFWASWCEPCVHELPLFERLYQVNDGLETPVLNVLLVNNGEAYEAAKTFLREDLELMLPSGFEASKALRESLEATGLRFNKTIEVVKAYRVRGMPTTFFIDAEGIIQAVKIGELLPEEAPALLASIGVAWQDE